MNLPGQTRSQGGKTKLTNHRAAIILHAISCGCYRETAAELASIKAETLSHWMGWTGEPYESFQRLVRKAEAGLESRMVTTVVAAPPHHLNFTVADILQKVQERIAQGRTQGQLPRATIINASVKTGKPHDPRPPRLTVVANPAEDTESQPT